MAIRSICDTTIGRSRTLWRGQAEAIAVQVGEWYDVLESPFVLRISGPGIDGILDYRLPFLRRVVGRSNVGGSDIKVFDDFAAPKHCAFDWDSELKCHKLTVLGVNGLYINDELVSDDAQPQILRNGDVIRIGETVLVYSHEKTNAARALH